MNYSPKSAINKAPTTSAILAKINSYPNLEKQAPNRNGNVSTNQPDYTNTKGVTAVTGSNKRGLSQPKGAQGAPKASGTVHAGCHCPVSVVRPKDNYGPNDSYLNGSSYKK